MTPIGTTNLKFDNIMNTISTKQNSPNYKGQIEFSSIDNTDSIYEAEWKKYDKLKRIASAKLH